MWRKKFILQSAQPCQESLNITLKQQMLELVDNILYHNSYYQYAIGCKKKKDEYNK